MLKSRPRFELSGSKDEDREVVTRTFKTLQFEPHARRKILILRGEIEISVTGVLYGEILEDNTQEFRKLIKLDGLNKDTNLRSVTEDILEQCPFIPEDLIPQMVGILEVLKLRKYDRNGFSILSLDGEPRGVPTFPEYFDDDTTSTYNDGDLKDVKMDSLDLYIELLYEDLEDKVKGARSLWKLTTSSENLVTIFNHDTAINAVFRTLREDHRKSVELTSNLLQVILAFTKFHDFHNTLNGNKVTVITLDIIDFELGRYDKWVAELTLRKELAEDPETTTSKNRAELEKMRTKFFELTRKQEVVLAAAFDIVKNMADPIGFSMELKARGLLRQMLMTLDRSNVKLITVVISFLANTSAYAETVEEMIEMKVVEQTFRFLDETMPRDLLLHLIQLYFNLSFTTKLRLKMVRMGVINKLAQLYDDVEFEGNALLTLYNISIDFKIRAKFATSDIIPKLISKVVTGGAGFQLETTSLLVNLAGSKRCATLMCDNLRPLVKIGSQRQDPLVAKVIRKISSHSSLTQNLSTELVTSIVASVREKSSPEYVVECLGTLSTLVHLDIDFCELLQGYQLLKIIRSVLLRPPPKIKVHAGDERSVEEALLLEVVIFLGTCASEPSCSDFLVQEGILTYMMDLGRAPALDTDIRIQLFYAFYRMSIHTKTRNQMIEKTQIADLIGNFIQSDCTELREITQGIWIVFGEYNNEWRDKARRECFMAHNEHWMEICGRNGQISLDRSTLKQFQARINSEKKVTRGSSHLRRNRVSAKSSDSLDDSDDDTEGETEEEEDLGERVPLGRQSALSEDLDGSTSSSDQSRSRTIFDQYKHQFNQEMVSRIYDSLNSTDDEEGRNKKQVGTKIEQQSINASGDTSRMSSTSMSRPGTSKSRPATAHHSGRLAGSSGQVRTSSTLGPSSSRVSFDGLSQNEPHPTKGMKPPIIVNIKPKESW